MDQTAYNKAKAAVFNMRSTKKQWSSASNFWTSKSKFGKENYLSSAWPLRMAQAWPVAVVVAIVAVVVDHWKSVQHECPS